ncbi:hypothetical protein BJQ94_17010 [Cryobacterium sp. SO2]|uniref:hypothetical protein n=1 Tax=Cryobacterium sp. SO2 TaxID=1897060 RepID=UPI00223CFFD2|nr:hypothetical protein [Cryobacterium sp. SO2]WEO77031.1 hypothetical protein BJQ94_17010 [Cryobacterium sp. SO2]
MKTLVASLVRRLAPETMRSLEDLATLRRQGESLPGLVARAERLEARVAEFAELEYAIDELRRDSLRIAELTDLVVTRVGALPLLHADQTN